MKSRAMVHILFGEEKKISKVIKETISSCGAYRCVTVGRKCVSRRIPGRLDTDYPPLIHNVP